MILVQYKVHFASVKILAIWSQCSQMPKIPSSRNIFMLTRANWKLEYQIWFYCDTQFNHFLSIAFEFMNFIWFLDSCPSLCWKRFSISSIILSPGSAKLLVHKYQKTTTSSWREMGKLFCRILISSRNVSLAFLCSLLRASQNRMNNFITHVLRQGAFKFCSIKNSYCYVV